MTMTQIVPAQKGNAMALVVSDAISMTSLEIAELVERRHDNVKRTIETLVKRGVIASPQIEEKTTAGRPMQVCVFSGEQGKRDSIIVVAQLSPELTARLVDRWQELEAQVAPAIPDFADPAAAARAWAEQYEARRIAERTKAEIGSRREATAMNTASQAVKQANKLAIDLDRSRQYATVKRMEMLYHGQKFNWRLLKSTASEMGIPSVDIFDANYGTVKAYHADVWREAYALEIEVLAE
ncbi:Rha family transcriptional regulator [Parapusillimonas sp. JC17]|uniref:Rha family transcriptional regulator n=1 Tax=Parapusillimonas sp. JC17 TaxID=3445768 RepID=UPI003FA023A0